MKQTQREQIIQDGLELIEMVLGRELDQEEREQFYRDVWMKTYKLIFGLFLTELVITLGLLWHFDFSYELLSMSYMKYIVLSLVTSMCYIIVTFDTSGIKYLRKRENKVDKCSNLV
jgi:hypothetical protein